MENSFFLVRDVPNILPPVSKKASYWKTCVSSPAPASLIHSLNISTDDCTIELIQEKLTVLAKDI
jgi:hypothetical protein